MRKMMLLAALAALKLGCCRLQEPASDRPETVKRSSTPPFGLLVLAVPLALKKNGKRASRVGPLTVMKAGVASLGATRGWGPLVKTNWGFTAGPVPPMAGCEWHEPQPFELKRGPRPGLSPVTVCVSANCVS